MDTENIFNPLIEGLCQQLCENDIKSETDLEQMLSLILTIGVNELDVDDINSILNVLIQYIKDHTDKFPSLTLLNFAKTFLDCLSLKYQRQSHMVALSWPNDLKVVVQRLIRTFKIPEEYIVLSYDLSSLASKALGTIWIKSDSQFAALMASLSSGRLRIVMESEENVKIEQLIPCLSLLEDIMQSVEDENSMDYLNDEIATSISKSCQEASTFLCEYIVALNNQLEGNICNKMEFLLVIYRFLCAFLAIGGGKIINDELLSSVLPILLKVCDFCQERGDTETAELLLMSLDDSES